MAAYVAQRTVADFFHPFLFLSCAGCYMGRRLCCHTQLQSLLMWWVFPHPSAEPSNDSAKAFCASGEIFSSCRSLLLQTSILGHYWLPSLLCMPVKEFLVVDCESTADCAWNQLSSSFSAFLMLSLPPAAQPFATQSRGQSVSPASIFLAAGSFVCWWHCHPNCRKTKTLHNIF